MGGGASKKKVTKEQQEVVDDQKRKEEVLATCAQYDAEAEEHRKAKRCVGHWDIRMNPSRSMSDKQHASVLI